MLVCISKEELVLDIGYIVWQTVRKRRNLGGVFCRLSTVAFSVECKRVCQTIYPMSGSVILLIHFVKKISKKD